MIHTNIPIVSFEAELLDGTTRTEVDHPSISMLPLDQVKKLTVTSYNIYNKDTAPKVTIVADPTQGERIFRATRRTVHLDPHQKDFAIEICGIKRVSSEEGDEVVVCTLYWHPDHGLVLGLGDRLH